MTGVVSGYRLVGRIRAGGMAEVLLGERILDGGGARRVAVKRLLPHLEGEPRFARALRAEAALMRRVRHANVVRAERYVEERGRGHLILELVDGIDLAVLRARARLRRRAVPEVVAAALMAQAATALDRVHAAGIVHGDVTPGNLLVAMGDRRGGAGAGRLKLCDFGVAHAIGSAARAPLAASAPYLAPERATGDRIAPGDERADAWSLGVCAWELLAGRRLFARGDLPSTLAAIRLGAPPPLALVRPGVSPSLAAIVDGALVADPDRRASARAIGDAFAGWLVEHADAEESDLALWLAALDDGRRDDAAPATAPITAILDDARAA